MAEEAYKIPRIKLGSQGFVVSAQGLGVMGLSAFYSAPTPETKAVALLRHTINSGITFLDTSNFYGPETNELLLGKALKDGLREKAELTTKFGLDGKLVWQPVFWNPDFTALQRTNPNPLKLHQCTNAFLKRSIIHEAHRKSQL